MIIFNGIISHFRLHNIFLKFIRPCHIHDKYFYYFRNNSAYKNCVVQLNDHKESKLVIPGISSTPNKDDVSTDEFFSHLLSKVMFLSTLELRDAMHVMANARIDSVKYEDALKVIDEKCARSVERWPLELSLYILDAWFVILKSKVFRKHYYFALSNLLNRKMKKCSKYNLILVLYFVGMNKQSPPFLMELMKYKMECFASDFTDEEWAIACLSFFKTSTKMDSQVLLHHCCKAAENFMNKNDHFNLISILKCLRLSKYFDSNLMMMLDNYIEKEYTTFNFSQCTNFLASFATQNIYKFKTYSCLENQGISQLLKEDIVTKFNKDIERIHPNVRSRVKDLARFLWGMSFVGHEISQESINFMLDLLTARLNSGEFESNLPGLIDCVQSLILFGQYPLNLIEYVLNPVTLHKISCSEKAKPKYQLYFISRSAYIENYITEIKDINFINNIPKNLQKEIIQRNGLKDLTDYLSVNLKKNSFKCCYIMPHIMISGILVASDKKENNNSTSNNNASTLLKFIKNGVLSNSIQKLLYEDKIYTCIELLDSSVCVHGTSMPLGLMKTKIRHLQKLNINVITLSPEEVYALPKDCSKIQDLVM